MGESKRKRMKRLASEQVVKPTPFAYDVKNKPGRSVGQVANASTQHASSKKVSRSKRRVIPATGQPDSSAQPAPSHLTDAPPIKQTGSWQLGAISANLWLKHYKACLVLFVLPSLMFAIGRLLAPDITDISNKTLAGVLLSSGALLWIFINLPVAYYLQTRAIHGLVPTIRETYRHGMKQFLRLLGLALLVTFLVIVGLLMFIIPGVILIRRYFLAPYYLIDQNLGIRQAMNRSAADSKAVSMYLWGMVGVGVTIALVSIILFSRVFPPFGAVISAFITSLFVFGPALRYREVALRQPAGSVNGGLRNNTNLTADQIN